jgi:hypothetical protein
MVNMTVTAASIEECHAIFVAGSIAVKEAGAAIFREYTEKSPWLQENYLSHPCGGGLVKRITEEG